MMQSIIETKSCETPSRARGSLFAPPRVVSPRIQDSSADGVSAELPIDQPTLVSGLPMSFRDRNIQSDSESECRPHVDISQCDSVMNTKASNCCANAVGSLAHYDSISDSNIPRRLAGTFPERENDINSQCSSSDINLGDVPLCDSSVKSSEFDLVHQLTSLSPCSPRRHCIMQQPTETNESNSASASRYYLQKINNKDIGSPGECAVEHLDSQLSRLRVNLPSVEDGLSSGSELDVQGSDHLSQQNYSQDTDKTKTLNTNCQLNSIMHDSASPSTTHSPSSSPIRSVSIKGSLVNPPLVQDIFGIMKDIKQALSEDANATTGNTKSPTDVLAPRVDDNAPRNNQSTVVPSCPEFGSDTNTIPSTTSLKSIISIYGPDVPTTGNCSRITVKASIEHQCDNSVPNDLPPERRNISLSSTENPQTASSPDTGKCAHHWRFPQPSYVAYSSDDDIAPIRPVTTAQRPSRSSGHRTRSRCPTAPPVARHQQFPVSDSASYRPAPKAHECEAEDTEKLLAHNSKPDNPIFAPELKEEAARQVKRQQHVREVSLSHPEFPNHLIHGFLFRARYLGSTQLFMKRQPTRKSHLYQAKEALFRVKDPDGDHQPSVAIELFISVERIMIMDHTLKEILIDHGLRTVSYIADMGEVLVLMARGPSPPQPADREGDPCDPPTTSPSSASTSSSTSGNASSVQTTTTTKLFCHVLECDEAQLVAQSVNHAFQLAYLDYLRENGVQDLSTVKHLRYEDAVNEQEIFCDELASFCNKEKEKQVTVVKQRGEPLGLVIVSSGWGSLLPTALLANMQPTGPAARCGQLNIGNRIIAVDGQSLVGLSLAECQSLIKACRNQISVRLTIVDCTPVTEVFIRRPSVEHQLGFSVQDGVICSLLRSGIAERGGIRVDHRIIEINDESVVAMPHEYIVRLLTVATGEIHIRTMPTAVFRLLTGQDTPKYI